MAASFWDNQNDVWKKEETTLKHIKPLAVLALCAALSPAVSAAGRERFPAVNVYPGYSDVKKEDWYYENAKLCYEIGLMTGTDQGFASTRILHISEVVAIAARIREALTGQAIPAPVPDPGTPWYQHYVDYLTNSGISVPEPEKEATRLEFVQLLAAVLPKGTLSTRNDISSLPDTADADVIAFYGSGILTGVDKYGSFAGDRTLSRMECAAMVSRIARAELQINFTPADYTPFQAAYLTPAQEMFTSGVTAEQFLEQVNSQIANWEDSLRRGGADFNWHLDTGDGKTVLEHVKEETLNHLNVTQDQGMQSYQDFDYQVYYSRLIQLSGKLLSGEEI